FEFGAERVGGERPLEGRLTLAHDELKVPRLRWTGDREAAYRAEEVAFAQPRDRQVHVRARAEGEPGGALDPYGEGLVGDHLAGDQPARVEDRRLLGLFIGSRCFPSPGLPTGAPC